MTRTERLAEFHRSLERATAEPEFLDRFYKSFMAISPKIQRVFQGTDMARLKRKLKSSLHVMTLAVDDAPGADDYMRFLGKTHRRLNLDPAHFDLWKGSLLKTAAECDPEFDDRTQAIWAEVIGNGIELMRSGMASRDSRTSPE
ncbi:MAG TPA: globin domain-containing protein [Wenzhouxiangellaceae bacterium]|nr:globin domain-containing protein [Wenzhouxiangellaceae bacterium]